MHSNRHGSRPPRLAKVVVFVDPLDATPEEARWLDDRQLV
jgi:hypothetical protein